MSDQITGLAPVYVRLAKASRFDDIKLLAAYAKARRNVANDNEPAPDEGANIDSVMKVRPTPAEIAAAGEDGLRFNNRGQLVSWRSTDGKWRKPVERYEQPRGEPSHLTERKAEDVAHSAWVVSLRGTSEMPPPFPVDTRYPSVGDMLEKINACHDAMVRAGVFSEDRQFLAWLGVDGNTPFALARLNSGLAVVGVTPSGIAWAADFLAGRVAQNETATEGSFVGAPDAAETIIVAAIDAGDEGDSILDMAIAGMTAREIAKGMGHNDNKAGEEWAVRSMDRSIEKLRAAAA